MIFKPILTPSWSLSRASWPYLEANLGHRGANLGHLGANLGPSWGHLGAILGHFGVKDQKRETQGQSDRRIGAIFGPLLGPISGLCWASGALLKRLETIKILNRKCPFCIVNYNTKWPSGGPREGQVGVMLGSSWHLQGILISLLIILATKVDIRGGEEVLGGGRPGPRRPLGRRI